MIPYSTEGEKPTHLVTFEYRLAFFPPGRESPYEWQEGVEYGEEGGMDDIETYHADRMWRQRSAIRYLVAEETGRRLDKEFHGLVSSQVDVRRGSLLVAVTLMLAAGIPLASFLSEFPDFIKGLDLLKYALGQDVVRAATILSARDNLANPPEISATGMTRSVNWPEHDDEATTEASPPPKKPTRPIPPMFRPRRVSGFMWVLRTLVLLFGLFLLLSEFQFTRDVLSGYVNIPDLRHRTVYLLHPGAASDALTERLLLQINNQGIGPARDVLVRLRVEDTSIQEFQVLSDELHRVEAANLSQGELDIWLERLASGAELQLYVVTNQPVNSGQVRFGTVSERGMGRALPAEVFAGSWQDYREHVVIQTNKPSEFTMWARQAGLAQFWEDDILRLVVVVSIGLVFLTWLFVDGLVAMVLFTILAFLVSWLFIDAPQPAGAFVLILTMFLLFILAMSFERYTQPDRWVNDFVFWMINDPGFYQLVIMAALLAVFVIAILVSIGESVPLHWLVAVFAGVIFYFLFGYAMEAVRRNQQ